MRRPTSMRKRSLAVLLVAVPVVAWAALVAGPLGCGQGVSQTLPGPRTPSENELETYARRHLLDARALRDEGRLEDAAAVAARGLQLRPDNAALHRVRARVLEDLGRPEEARAHWRVADLIDPPPGPAPEEPLALPSAGLDVVMLPPPTDPRLANRVPTEWPDHPLARLLEARLRTRLPEARISTSPPDRPASIPVESARLAASAARAALSVRVDRAFCGETLKDGAFAVAWLRVAAAAPGQPPVVEEVRSAGPPPRDGSACDERVLAHALEEALSLPSVVARLEAPLDPRADWDRASVRALHPSLERRVQRQLQAGREEMRLGDLAAAVAHFELALTIDPEHRDAHAFADQARETLASAVELARQDEAGSPSRPAVASPPPRRRSGNPAEAHAALLPPLIDDAERRRLEARLDAEKARRRELLAVLAALGEDSEAPAPDTLAALRMGPVRDADRVGARLARERVPPGSTLREGLLFAPNGDVVARYLFADEEVEPVLREEDGDGDGRSDRWVVYRAGRRSEVFEDRVGDGHPDLRLVFADDGGPIQRVEIDLDGDGRPERIFAYRDGRLESERRDTNGDGSHDLFEHFDEAGSLALREEDLNGDGRVDVRTAYREGRLVSRQIVNPDAVTAIP